MSAALWHAVFGNDRPVEIEIGPGRGDVILSFAASDPGTNFFGIDIRRTQAAAITARATALALTNVRVIAGDARCIVQHLVPAGSVRAYHVYFPDPWPKTRHRARRLFRAELATDLARTLAPGGRVHVASDLAGVLSDARTVLEAAGFAETPSEPARTRPITRFERKYGTGGIHAAVFAPPQAAAGSPSPQKTS
jgi:tRNA (guanine-N7-)-methyltransferase